MMKYSTLVMVLAAICSIAILPLERAWAQHRFDLVAPQLGVASQAVLTTSGLQVIDSHGNVTDYERDARFDSGDGTWLGFYGRNANQILRWPATNRGRMQIGSIRGGVVEYRSSQMTIRALPANPQRVVERPILPPAVSPQVPAVSGLLAELAVSKLFDVVSSRSRPANAEMVRIASYDARGTPWVLSRGTGFDLGCVSSGSTAGADWWVAPAGSGYVRVETYDRGRVHAVSAGRDGQLTLQPMGQDPHQLWHVAGAGRVANRFLLENVAYPGNCLAHTGGGHVALQPVSYAPTQMWMPYAAPVVPTFQPFLRSASTEILPNAQLPPAKLELENTHRYALIVLLGDSRKGDAFEQFRIEPRSSVVLTLERDSGATIVETVEVRSAGGGWQRQQYVTAVPPRSFYDLSIYEEHLQSIAIDATGKSPNPIEDVNYVPKSVGWLPLPADLPASGRSDIYPRAKSANNPGAVRRMDPKQFDDQPTNPLETILQRYQTVPRRKF